jgi:hypothetical protein
MKNITTIAIVLLLGFLIGWAADGERTPTAAQKNAETKELARLYPSQLALTAFKDMRVIALLDSNNVAMARRLLVEDLDTQLSSLDALSRELQLTDFDKRALSDGRAFLEKNKR